MRKLIVILIMSALPATSLAGPRAEAPAQDGRRVVLYLHADEEAGCTGAGLSTKTRAAAPQCGSPNNLLQEPQQAAGGDYTAVEWRVGDGPSLPLDASRPITGEITIGSLNGLGAGQARLDVAVTAKVGNKDVTVGTFSEVYNVTPDNSHTVAVNIAPKRSLDGVRLDKLALTTVSRGIAAAHGYYSLTDPASFITIPLPPAPPLELTSPAFKDGNPIPTRYACFGGNVSPPLEWSGGVKAKSYVLALIDIGREFAGARSVMWIAYDIPGATKEMRAGQLPRCAKENHDYVGPCPPPGAGGVFIFALVAVDDRPPADLRKARTAGDLRKALRRVAVDAAYLSGTIRRR